MKKFFVGLLLLCIFIAFTACKNTSLILSSENPSITTSVTITTSKSQAGTTTATTATTTVKKTDPTKAVNNVTKAAVTAKKTTTKNTQNAKKVVQRANPETGISWDGKSPIIYTYQDGSTGTVPKDGATYEGLPGIITTYYVPKDGNNRAIGSICVECSKPVGNGDIGSHTCYQTSYSKYCFYCGAWLNANTCHSCKSEAHHCTDCGKIMGDGLNGTCVTWLMGDVDCPNCGEHVGAHVCHTCK